MSTESLEAGSQSQQADAQQSAATAAPATPAASAATDASAATAATQQQSDSTQAEGGKPASQAKEQPAQQEQKPVVPEKYEFSAPEGKQFDAAVLDAYSEVAREVGLSQDAAQKLLAKMAPALADTQTGALGKARQDWADASTTDKEFGGDKLSENLAIAKRGLDTFGSPELSKLLNESGLGNHPEIIRAFYRAGKAISDDKVVTGAPSATPSAKSIAATLYDKSPARSN